jgi:hypothetical protein
MHEKKDHPKKTHEETHRSEPHKDPKKDRDGEVATVAGINPPPDGGKVRGDGDKPPGGPVR